MGKIERFMKGLCGRGGAAGCSANGGWCWRGWRHGGPEAAAACGGGGVLRMAVSR